MVQEEVTIERLEHYVLALARQLLCHNLGISGRYYSYRQNRLVTYHAWPTTVDHCLLVEQIFGHLMVSNQYHIRAAEIEIHKRTILLHPFLVCDPDCFFGSLV